MSVARRSHQFQAIRALAPYNSWVAFCTIWHSESYQISLRSLMISKWTLRYALWLWLKILLGQSTDVMHGHHHHYRWALVVRYLGWLLGPLGDSLIFHRPYMLPLQVFSLKVWTEIWLLLPAKDLFSTNECISRVCHQRVCFPSDSVLEVCLHFLPKLS